MKEIKILTPIGMLGYGVPEVDFEAGLEAGADVVIVDSGSTDPGPYQLGLGETLAKPEAYVRDLRVMLKGCTARGVPLLIGSAGGPGTAKHVDDMVETIQRIGAELGKSLKIVAIYADVDPGLVSARFAAGRTQSCASAPELTQADIDQSVHIVAQMGAEPIYQVLREHPDVDVVVAGRAYDPAPFAAFCMLHGIEPGIYWHMGKIMECGGACAEPKGKVILATVRADSFDLEPLNPAERCTPTSVAAHTLYEKSRPDLLAGPGGVLDLRSSKYEALDDRRVRVSGSIFHPASTYQVKLEGAAIDGYRTIFIGGVRDPILIAIIDKALISIRQYLQGYYPEMASGEAQINFHVYGKHAVMGKREPLSHHEPHEVGILGEVTASTQTLANAICSTARIAMLHMPYPGQMATGGNFAIPLNPPENPIGPVCRFSLYHLMDVESPCELFPSKVIEAHV
ncbi:MULTISPECIES: acyclic terpene utilization AtuA family protein [unclassified Pseudomonas]|uniref:acyclic terpene utilization AtuA family protein n=1 Tax=unclassified Pseudomonas TaxID=196821 RepID=UPI002AC8CBAB|nr:MULTISPECIES: acyclic terpene utilization AtuA family protein [unclassified Pseudomonas]MEB0039303.1 acyclic terpene utilization AtuA family protein [Pseudomonas sp. MH10]MEB0119742.1 acyclic terpene utilization AtuA family protein [Pseudomonas sp. CCI1.2]WPX64910.1 acyclic terpene utilization AtuA family protein [Pseudomonas sp. MH10]